MRMMGFDSAESSLSPATADTEMTSTLLLEVRAPASVGEARSAADTCSPSADEAPPMTAAAPLRSDDDDEEEEGSNLEGAAVAFE